MLSGSFCSGPSPPPADFANFGLPISWERFGSRPGKFRKRFVVQPSTANYGHISRNVSYFWWYRAKGYPAAPQCTQTYLLCAFHFNGDSFFRSPCWARWGKSSKTLRSLAICRLEWIHDKGQIVLMSRVAEGSLAAPPPSFCVHRKLPPARPLKRNPRFENLQKRVVAQTFLAWNGRIPRTETD